MVHTAAFGAEVELPDKNVNDIYSLLKYEDNLNNKDKPQNGDI